MLKTQAINHEVRRMLGIGAVHYIIADCCAQHHHLFDSTSISSISSELGLSLQITSRAIDDMRSLNLLEIGANGAIYPTKDWYFAQFMDVSKPTPEQDGLARDVMLYFNEVNGSKFQLPNNIQLIQAIIKAYPKLTLEHFQSVILHKLETWAVEDKMKEYNRPSTLFRSAKQFMRYLDDATYYWNQKQKNAAGAA